ncbi:unnamed protein product [Oppiella nova]|uniref:BAR domain-containing protein n=1 Tax=Oppiella nova TaxID=334625 RepID=A0A7R9M4D7_9ACAR|nr:unnamed protein product [Oppiella nova]CAG2169214.1 unnamed protein product [Oppiella nova]
MIAKTRECLHPNPTLRAKVVVNNKIMGTKWERYEHSELDLLTQIKYSLEDDVKHNFLDPLSRLQSADLRECMNSRRKLEGRRLDYDCTKRKKSK